MTYLVIACPRCRRARIVAQGKSGAPCAACGRDLRVEDLRAFAKADDLGEAQAAVGALNARLAGAPQGFDLPAAPVRERRHDSVWMAAASAARTVVSERDRADAVARALARELGAFGPGDLARAFDLAGLPDEACDAHLSRMLATSVLYEPRPGRFRALA